MTSIRNLIKFFLIVGNTSERPGANLFNIKFLTDFIIPPPDFIKWAFAEMISVGNVKRLRVL